MQTHSAQEKSAAGEDGLIGGYPNQAVLTRRYRFRSTPLLDRRKPDERLRSNDPEGKRFSNKQANLAHRVAMITNRKILSHSQFRIAAAGGDKQRILQKFGVDDVAADLAFNN